MDRGTCLGTLLVVLLAVVGGAGPWTVPAMATEIDAAPPYHVRRFDLVDLPIDRLPWTADPPPRLPALAPLDRHGIRLYRREDGRLHYRPGGIAINGMKRIDAYRDTGDRAQLEQALVQARHLRRTWIEQHDAGWLPFWFDYPPEGLRAPWFNAMTQGLALSFFVRLHRVTGDAVHLRAAERVFESFLRLGPREREERRTPAGRVWVAYVDERDYLWLEHYPTVNPDHVLNAHLHSLIGIYEYWQHTRSAAARQVLEGALTTMRDRALRYRRQGRASIYGLRSRTNHLKYHQVHIWQFRLLGRMTGDPFFRELGDLMASDHGLTGEVPGRPAESRMDVVLGSSRRALQKAPYPPAMPYLRLAG